MTRSILVGLDGSTYSNTAVELGIAWAKRFDAMLVGLGVVDQPTIAGREPLPLGVGAFKQDRDEAMLRAAHRDVEQFLEKFAIRCADAGVSCKLLEDVGLPREEICLEAQRYDLIILGKQTYFHFETQSGPDDTLAWVLKHSPRPVVTVPEQLRTGGSIIVAYDGSLQAARTLQAFLWSGLATDRAVHVVSTHNDHAEAARNAERAMDYLHQHDIKSQAHVLDISSPAAGIMEQAGKLDAGLVVMGAYGKSTMQTFFFGSVTQNLLKEKSIPLFLFH